MEFSLHPGIYSTGRLNGLRSMLEDIWVRSHTPGDGTFYLISGFANFNGGARFYRTFREHVDCGGKLVAFLGGSSSQRLSSKQVVEALLDCGAEVNVINRKRILHAKCYGAVTSRGNSLVVTSGNFTGPGMSQNVESAVLLRGQEIQGFSWDAMAQQIYAQSWMRYRVDSDLANPVWQLLYDESVREVKLDESEEVSLVVVLGHADTVRVQADPGSRAGLGSQYFWLSKDSFDFFPPLTIRNKRGIKGTLSALVTLHYIDLGVTDTQCRVTFEAENNLDFRLGTGKLRYTKLAKMGDIACISRVGEDEYELRIIPQESEAFASLRPYAIHFIGHQGKMYGYLDNSKVEEILQIKLK